MAKKLFIAEKPAAAKNIMESFGEEGDCAFIAPRTHSYIFELDLYLDQKESLKYSDIEYIGNYPFYAYYGNVYKMNNGKIEIVPIKALKENINARLNNNENEILEACNKSKEFIESFDEIYMMCDLDHTGVRAFDFYFEKFIGYESIQSFFNVINKKNIPMLNRSLYQTLGSQSMTFPQTEHSKNIIEFRNLYKKKDYSEYIFNSFSRIFFDDILKRLDIRKNLVITRNMLLSLFILESKKMIREGAFMKRLENFDIGSAVSRSKILENLIDIGFIATIKVNNDTNKIMLSDKGQKFLNNIDSSFRDKKNMDYLNSYYFEDDSYYKNSYNILIELFKKQEKKNMIKKAEFLSDYLIKVGKNG